MLLGPFNLSLRILTTHCLGSLAGIIRLSSTRLSSPNSFLNFLLKPVISVYTAQSKQLTVDVSCLRG